MKRKKPKGLSDTTLMALWRRAVLAYWGYRDPISRDYDPTGENLQCHHVVPRKHFITRWDYRNGIPLTVESHQYAHTLPGRREVEGLVDIEYLESQARIMKKDYLMQEGISDVEFRRRIKQELLEVIDER